MKIDYAYKLRETWGIPHPVETGQTELKRRIAQAITSNPDKKKCWQAMKQIKWALRSPDGQYAGLRNLLIVPVSSLVEAQIFDGRDNDETKLSFYRLTTGINWQIEVLCAS